MDIVIAAAAVCAWAQSEDNAKKDRKYMIHWEVEKKTTCVRSFSQEAKHGTVNSG